MITQIDGSLRSIVEFKSQIRYENLPDAVTSQVKRVLLDTLGCMFAGINTPTGKQSMAFAARFPDPNGTFVPGVNLKISPPMAAAANGALANVLDGDDGHRTAKGHPAGVIVPAAMASAQMKEISGRCLAEAIVTGYEIGLRAGLAINSGDIYYGSGNWATFGAAAAAAYIFDLPGAKLINALGICEVQTPICQLMGWIEDRRIPSIKEAMGWSATTGLSSALMADEGITGTVTIFKDKENKAKLQSLGSEFEILQLYFKRYNSCRWTHSALDNLFSLMKQHQFLAEHIASIHVATFHRASLLDTIIPESIEQAQYSIPFLLAVAAIDGDVGPEQMTLEKFNDPMIVRLAEKVKLEVDQDMEKYFPERALSRVTVTTIQGDSFNAFEKTTLGDWNNPLSDKQMEDKFRIYAGQVLSDQRVEQVMEMVQSLENLESIDDLLQVG